MSGFQTAKETHKRATQSARRDRQLKMRGQACYMCGVEDPELLKLVDVPATIFGLKQAVLCRNHRQLLTAYENAGALPYGFRQSEKLTVFDALYMEANFADMKRHSSLNNHNQLATEHAAQTLQLSNLIEDHSTIKKRLKKAMKQDPFGTHADCYCAICHEVRPIVLEAHHVDREGLSERAVILCHNHHDLVSIEQRYHPDKDALLALNEKYRDLVAQRLGLDALEKLAAMQKEATSKVLFDDAILMAKIRELANSPDAEPSVEELEEMLVPGVIKWS
jgi:hypothetical protein